jgi:hypothetical protein
VNMFVILISNTDIKSHFNLKILAFFKDHFKKKEILVCLYLKLYFS